MSSPSNPSVQLYAQGGGTASSAQFPSSPVVQPRSPAATDIQGAFGVYPIGQEWINSSTGSVYVLVSYTPSNGVMTANWTVTGGSSSDVSGLTADTGSASPVGGNIKIAGTANEIATSGSGSTVTLSITSPLNAPGSVIAGDTATSHFAGLCAAFDASSGFTGVVGTVGYTGWIHLATSTGVGTVKMTNVNNANSVGWIKIYFDTTPYYIPIWSDYQP